MKILVISHTYIAPINRDKWKAMAHLYPNDEIRVLFPTQWPTHLFTHQADNPARDNLANCQFIALDTFYAGNEVRYGYKVKQLYKLLKNFRPDIIHVEQGDNAFSYFQVICLSKYIALRGILKGERFYPKFVFFTWVNWQARFSLKYRMFWRWLEKFNLAHASGAIVGNNDARDILNQKNFSKPTLVLPQLGVNQEIFKPPVEKKQTQTIGFLGRLVPEKGIQLLVEVFGQLKQNFPDWKLLIVGRGPEQVGLETYVCDNNIQDVSFHPPVSHYQMSDLINSLDILVLPSYDTPDWKEQFGHILIEAMACGVPVIGSSAGEIPNVIHDAGLIFEQKNHRALLDSLKTLMQDYTLSLSLGRRGLEHVSKNYSHQAIAVKTHEFWESIMS